MRKFLSAGVLAAATTIALLPTFTAQATVTDNGRDAEPTWTYVEDFHILTDCMDEGMTGQLQGDWGEYRCILHGYLGEWALFVGDNDDDGDDD